MGYPWILGDRDVEKRTVKTKGKGVEGSSLFRLDNLIEDHFVQAIMWDGPKAELTHTK